MPRFWKTVFFALPLCYGLYYAPFGVNETDGGFLTGLAWQVLCGKVLYADAVYVRPPLPVWLRALELCLLPENWASLGERWIFYFKVAAYSWLGAAVLSRDSRRWMVAGFGFVVSAHCYPATAWHTVDGLLFGALGLWCWTNTASRTGAFFSGLALAGCLLCKQSFYPMLLFWAALLASSIWAAGPREKTRERMRALFASLGLGAGAGLFFAYLFQHDLFEAFFLQTGGSTSGSQAWQHGVADYFRIHPAVAGPGVLLLLATGWFLKNHRARPALGTWAGFLLLLAGSFAWAVWKRQEFTAPFAQSRLMLWMAAGYVAYLISPWRHRSEGKSPPRLHTSAVNLAALLSLSWCASVSWGYSLPILFAVPWVYAALEIGRSLFQAARLDRYASGATVLSLLCLLALFRLGYHFVYRDGSRAAMTEPLGPIFPSMQGLYSSPRTAARYRDLRDLCRRYGPAFKTLPSFPQSNFLTKTLPPLPLDWVVEREMGLRRDSVAAQAEKSEVVFFIEKSYGERLASEPELRLTRALLQKGKLLEETDFFRVIRL